MTQGLRAPVAKPNNHWNPCGERRETTLASCPLTLCPLQHPQPPPPRHCTDKPQSLHVGCLAPPFLTELNKYVSLSKENTTRICTQWYRFEFSSYHLNSGNSWAFLTSGQACMVTTGSSGTREPHEDIDIMERGARGCIHKVSGSKQPSRVYRMLRFGIKCPSH